MKKLLFLLLIYVLVEGNNIIGDGLYVWHRGKHAVEELATQVDNYYPKVQAVDSLMGKTINEQLTDTIEPVPVETSSTQRQRRIIRR